VQAWGRCRCAQWAMGNAFAFPPESRSPSIQQLTVYRSSIYYASQRRAAVHGSGDRRECPGNKVASHPGEGWRQPTAFVIQPSPAQGPSANTAPSLRIHRNGNVAKRTGKKYRDRMRGVVRGMLAWRPNEVLPVVPFKPEPPSTAASAARTVCPPARRRDREPPERLGSFHCTRSK